MTKKAENSNTPLQPRLDIAGVRQRAMLWWNNLDDNLNDGFSKWKLGYKYYDRHWMSLTGREIEIIYKCEHVA